MVKKKRKRSRLRWSYTKMKCFETCKEKFYRQYIAREKVIENERKFLEGSVLQEIFEYFVNEGHYKRDDGIDWIHENIKVFYDKFLATRKRVKFKPEDSEEKILKKLKKSADNVYQMFKTYDLFNVKQFKSEYSILEDLDDQIEIQAKLDFLVEKDSNLFLFDLKNMTSRNSKYIDRKQLVFYNLAFYLKFHQLPKGSFFFTCKDAKVIPGNIRGKDVNALLKKIREYTKIVGGRDYRKKVKDKKPCWECKFKPTCWGTDMSDITVGEMKL